MAHGRQNFSKKHQRAVLAGQVWDPPNGTVRWRVMAVSEGYAMGRYPRCAPGVIAINPGMDDWKLVAQGKEPAK